jgi:hypothetical protein
LQRRLTPIRNAAPQVLVISGRSFLGEVMLFITAPDGTETAYGTRCGTRSRST